MNIGAIVGKARKAAADNAPTILTAIGVTGLVTTAVLTGKASFKAAEVIREIEAENSTEHATFHLATRGRVNYTWKYFIPAAATLVTTGACIIGANQISTRRTAALASAYSITQEAFREYREKIIEKVGEKKEQAARDEIAQEQVSKNPPAEVIMIGSGDVLCMDLHSGRYFNSDKESIRKVINDINYEINNNNYASLSDFYHRIGLESTSESDDIGWNTSMLLDIKFASALAPDGRPCLTIEFHTVPVRGYYQLY